MTSPRPCTVLAVDPGTTSGLLVLSIKPSWIKGAGTASWEGLSSAITFKAAYQVGRYPKRFDIDSGFSTAIDRPEALDEALLPVLAVGQPLLGDGEFDGRGRKDAAFYGVLRGDPAGVGRGDLSVVDAGEVMQVRQIAGLLDNFPSAALVIEDFTLRQMGMDREMLSPTRLRLGIETEEILHGEGRVPFLQQPADAKRTVTDERLKRMHLYFSGMPHANDAARHAVTFLRKCRATEALRAQAFPRHFDGWKEDEHEL